jgi:uncharacterized membrane protein
MSCTVAQMMVFAIGVLHVLFMLGELFPWNRPIIMGVVLGKWRRPLNLGPNETQLLSSVVHNAGIYNGIVASGLFATFWLGPSAFLIQVVLLTGGIVAGLFGAATLTRGTIAQALLGAIALVAVLSRR